MFGSLSSAWHSTATDCIVLVCYAMEARFEAKFVSRMEVQLVRRKPEDRDSSSRPPCYLL